MTSRTAGGCRSCGTLTVVRVLDLGDQPVADELCADAASAFAAPRHPLSLGACQRCGLVQLDPSTPIVPNATHGHGSAFSGTVLEHEHRWAEELLALPNLSRPARVLDVGSESGGFLRAFRDAGHAVRGWERDGTLAANARASGIPTVQLDGNRHREPGQYDLVLVNHTLSHADDLDGAVRSLSDVLAPDGVLAVEFHSALGILEDGQFDVICHAHRSYLSLTALTAAFDRHGLVVLRAWPLPLHGGVIRLQAARAGVGRRQDGSVTELLAVERVAGLGSAEAWVAVAEQATRIHQQLYSVLAAHRRAGRTVAGYGAPSRGTTLLNYCGLGSAEVPRTADRSPLKQNHFLPGAAIRVCTPEELFVDRPDVLLVLVWPLRNEVLLQLADLRDAGTRFLFPLPEPEEVT
jgi:SAM-dependent methyltransferase